MSEKKYKKMKVHNFKYSEIKDNPCVSLELDAAFDYETNLKEIYNMISLYKVAQTKVDMKIKIDWLKFEDAEKLKKIADDNNYSINLMCDGNQYSIDEVVQIQAESKRFIEIVKKVDLTPLEQVAFIYNFVASRMYKDSNDWLDSRELYKVLSGDDIVCVGFANLFKYLCDNLVNDNIKSTVASVSFEGRKRSADHMNNIVYVKDDEYRVNGYYVMDACFDCMEREDEEYPLFGFFLNTASEFRENMLPTRAEFICFKKDFVGLEKILVDLGMKEETKIFYPLVSEAETERYLKNKYNEYRHEFISYSEETIKAMALAAASGDKIIHLFTEEEKAKNKQASLEKRRDLLVKNMNNAKEYPLSLMYEAFNSASKKIHSACKEIDNFKFRDNTFKY